MHGNLRTYQRYAIVLGLVSGVMAIVLVFTLYLVIKRPLNRLIGIFAEVENGKLDVNLATRKNDEFGFLLHAFGNMLDRLKHMIDRVCIQDINLKRSELKQLQAQINPHFLYNTFNILTQSIKRYDQETALQMSRYLAEYFNYMTKNNTEDELLGKEFVFAETYLQIQKIRFKDRIDIQFHMIGEDHREIRVPRMILQPLVENAYKHGLDNLSSGGILRVDWTAYEDRLSISVFDNGKCCSAVQALGKLGTRPSIMRRKRSGMANSRITSSKRKRIPSFWRPSVLPSAPLAMKSKSMTWSGIHGKTSRWRYPCSARSCLKDSPRMHLWTQEDSMESSVSSDWPSRRKSRLSCSWVQ